MNIGKSLTRAIFLAVLLTVGFAVQAQPAKAWTKILGQQIAADNSPDVVKTDSLGNEFVAKTRGFRGTRGLYGIVEVTKLSPTGSALWTVSLLGQGSGLGRATGLTVDGSGNPIVLQVDNFSYLTGAGPIVTKLNGATGAKVWATNLLTLTSATSGICNDTSGNVFVGGVAPSLSDARMAVTKLAATTGATAWTRTVARVAAGVSDYLGDMAIDGTGNVALVGTAHPTDACNTTAAIPFVIARVRGTDGAQLWVTTYNNLVTDKVYTPRVGVDTAGNVCIGGTAMRVSSPAWIFSKRAATTGASTWAKAVVPIGTTLSFLSDLAVDGTGGVAGAGDGFGISGSGVYVNRLSSAGGQSWSKMLSDRQAGIFTPLGLPARRLIAYGSASFLCCYTRDTVSMVRPTSIAIVNRLNVTNGVSQWEKTYNAAGTSQTQSVCLALAPNGDPIVGCYAETASPNYPTIQTGVVRLNYTGGVLVHSGATSNAVIPTPDYGAHVIVDTSGNSYVVGGSVGRIMTAKFNSAGTQLWVNLYDSAATDSVSGELDGGRLIARDGSGNIIVAGENRGQIVILKLSNSTGGALWSRRINGSLGFKMALNAAGDVYVPIESPSQLVKITGTTGVVAWTSVMNGTGGQDTATFAATDSTGNPFVSGTTTDIAPCPDDDTQRVMVERFNPSTGAKVWLKELTPYKVGHNEPCGIGIDTGGNVLVGGTAEGVSSTDFMAAKLNPTTGAVLWNTRHDYLNKQQEATAMVVDGAGNLVITGLTAGTTYRDGWTVKVLDATGAKSWSSVATTPVGDRWPYDIARDGANNIYIGGLVTSGTSAQQFGLKLTAATGVPIWTVLTSLGLGTNRGGVGVAVSTTNRLHMVGSNVGTSNSLSNLTLVQFNP